jgi:hypothetical protein
MDFFQDINNSVSTAYSDSEFKGYKNEKTPENTIGGPVGWKNMGPLPLLFPPPPRPAFFGRLFFP